MHYLEVWKTPEIGLFSGLPSLKLNEIRRLDAASLKKVAPQPELDFMGNPQHCYIRLFRVNKQASALSEGGKDATLEGFKAADNGTMPGGGVNIPNISLREGKGGYTKCAKVVCFL